MCCENLLSPHLRVKQFTQTYAEIVMLTRGLYILLLRILDAFGA